MTTHVRRFQEADAETLARLYFDSVRHGTGRFYSAEQREAWARDVPDTQRWAARLRSITTLVAEKSDDIAGFMTLDNTGYIDLAFVRPDYIGQGVGTTLYEYLLEEARLQGVSQLHTQASEMARPFFEKLGWKLVKSQSITREGVILTNHLMETSLR